VYGEKTVPFTSRTPTYLTPEQRHELTQIPADLSDREIARYYTFTQKDLDLIKLRSHLHNRLGFAVQLAVLRFPGRPLKDLAGVPSRVLAAIADQIQVPISAFARYGDRDNTLYEHLDEIRQKCGFGVCVSSEQKSGVRPFLS
jgi:TnpA family transposase